MKFFIKLLCTNIIWLSLAMDVSAEGCYAYEHWKYKGKKLSLSPGENMEKLDSYWNDRISSIKVSEGCYLTGWIHHKFTGQKILYNKDTEFIGESINDQLSSLYCYCDYKDEEQTFWQPRAELNEIPSKYKKLRLGTGVNQECIMQIFVYKTPEERKKMETKTAQSIAYNYCQQKGGVLKGFAWENAPKNDVANLYEHGCGNSHKVKDEYFLCSNTQETYCRAFKYIKCGY